MDGRRRTGTARWRASRTAIGVAVTSALALSAAAFTQVAEAAVDAPVPSDVVRGRDPGWIFTVSEFADLWFGSLAAIGYAGSGGTPLYDPAYAARRRVQMARAGIERTPIDTEARRLRAALSADPAFELLHFVPVYFAGASADEALAALAAVAETRAGVPSGLPTVTRFGASVVGSVLAGPSQRRVLAELVSAVEAEHEATRGVLSGVTGDAVARVQERWNRELAPGLDGFLGARALESGRVYLSLVLGLEGRFFSGDPDVAGDNVVVLGWAPGVSAPSVVSGLVRELCYPLVREAFAATNTAFADRHEAARTSDRAATRCGARLLAELAPEALPHYERRFGTTRGFSGPDLSALDRALDAHMLRSIRKR